MMPSRMRNQTHRVAIMNPLQQGLKHLGGAYLCGANLVAIMNPLQQGLKHYNR